MENNDLIATDAQKAEDSANGKIPVGISACLVGQPVRYNGGHSQSKLCMKKLSPYFNFVTFCPEVAAGFSIPRPTMRLIGDPKAPTLTYSDDQSADLTQQLVDGFQNQLLEASNFHGYVLMKNSPSCGMERVKVYAENGYPNEESSRGLFADALKKTYPSLPLEEEGRLNDPHLRENFIGRVFAHYAFHTEVLSQPSHHRLLKFHAHYKYYLMAHSQQEYKALGQFLATQGKEDISIVARTYFDRFMAAIAKPAKRSGHVNAMQHVLGYLKKSVPSAGRRDMVKVIERYAACEVNLETPMTLLQHYIGQLGNEYIRSQRYLSPYPENLGLRNLI